ncbi:hypothetical protein OG874_16030 [Nocardia sp. NBC_00565]|uniref:hypothetical protein n=1 Tax=Nocardia sp. NBC_00565 TaxID=2975993 RepID=UPI002E8076E2|nr:hypothetical protein [Nocardia sp. NBC_00565]WUC06539.1 hypothetical protein OG874_16030 [Nocardia sp. NBC_00565]
MSAHDRINAANAEAARTAGWPVLTGTPAQIGWASTIRVDKMREFDTAAAAITDSDRGQFREVMLRETAAGVWIGGRCAPWQAMLVTHLTDDERAALVARPTDRP